MPRVSPLWAVDQFGHGQSPGERGQFGTLEDSSRWPMSSPAGRAGVPRYSAGGPGTFIRCGGDVVPPAGESRSLSGGCSLRGTVIPIAELVDLNTVMNLDAAGLSTDPRFYVDLIENDPLAFTNADSRNPTRELDRGLG